MDLDSAIGKHAEWKMKFRTAIARQESMDAESIAKDNCCELGKWLHADGKTKFGKLLGHTECLNKHAAFHAEAGKVARTINAKKYSEAEAMLASGTSYAIASNAIGVAIMHLKKEAGI